MQIWSYRNKLSGNIIHSYRSPLNWKPAGAICWNADNSSGKELFLRRLRIVRCIGNKDVYLKLFEDKRLVPNEHTTSNRRRVAVDITSIRRRPNSTNFYVISAYSFDIISMVEKSTWFPCTFLDVISMVKKSTLFPRIFISVISMVEICTLFLLTFFDVILMVKELTSFLVSCKIFPVFVTLNSWLLQDCSL